MCARAPGTYGGGRGQRNGGTELEFDPWCSRWDAILFIVLIISEYIVRTRHAAPRSRMREIYAIETTPSPPPPPAGPPIYAVYAVPVYARPRVVVFPLPFSTGRPAVPSKLTYVEACVDARNLCGTQVNELRSSSRESSAGVKPPSDGVRLENGSFTLTRNSLQCRSATLQFPDPRKRTNEAIL